MGGEFDPEQIRNYSLRRRLANGRLPEVDVRAILWELAREDALDGRFGWFKRRTLTRYGVSLGIPAAEARLLVLAAEWEALRGDRDDTGRADSAAFLAGASGHTPSVSPIHLIAYGVLAAIADTILLVHLLR